ncbi:hypothetical protein Poli38472_014758 [Pythium oligandrum]|uniref:Peptidase S33 tripeptidyl aminopeptidase-like C-terminal domain-containing protein n=1 Tax=Pythium oligandrum TaxID=41045 RepID=A0A8K1C2J6_PYTOL|nr:hypothetical protein Poli38472_014758 [Pythium oligandrum]|eukprot:TMW54987.1 hypothetical protein Poli38472_014758 [Pythium oligandrum]
MRESGNSSDPSCSALKQYGEQLATPMDFSALDTSYKVLYSGDKYYGSFASIPVGAGALVMSSKLDWEFPSSWASDQYEHMTGSNKRLIEFDTNAHGSEFVFSTPEDHNDCAASVLASYVLSFDADVAHVNASCVEDLPQVEFSG